MLTITAQLILRCLQLDLQLAAACDVMEMFCDQVTCVLATEAASPGEKAWRPAEVDHQHKREALRAITRHEHSWLSQGAHW